MEDPNGNDAETIVKIEWSGENCPDWFQANDLKNSPNYSTICEDCIVISNIFEDVALKLISKQCEAAGKFIFGIFFKSRIFH